LILLRNRIRELDEREKRLDAREKDLKFLAQDIEQKIKQLGELQRRLEGPAKKRQIEEQAKLRHLAGVYSSMDPTRAAALLDKLDDDTVT
jgi:flagellar motility protein MotE (MotC chaperone)